ncbi:MAG TPA: glycerophosphodiester phosphodiesterase [Candidatus Limnocylindrales bacterium]|nr:glycerophosphodiester phosphodiesterase [Candidatus Limnocylindrales bacterium]
MATLRLAHRGDWRAVPENSLAAMRAALAIPGCDGLEFDVRSSFDSVAVLLHDATLARIQKVPLSCSTLTAAQLAEHGIPTLGEVLKTIGCDPFLDVELKEPVQGAIDALELERGRIEDDGRAVLRNAALSSFDAPILAWLRVQRPDWLRWLNAYDLSPETIELATSLGCEAISAEHRGIDEAGVARAADAGLKVASWTVRELSDYRRLEALGVTAICVEAAALDG